jgi:hypothetical protein
LSNISTSWKDRDYYHELIRTKYPRHRDRVHYYAEGYARRHPNAKVPYFAIVAYFWAIEIKLELAEGWREWG